MKVTQNNVMKKDIFGSQKMENKYKNTEGHSHAPKTEARVCFTKYNALLVVGILFIMQMTAYIHFCGTANIFDYFTRQNTDRNSSSAIKGVAYRKIISDINTGNSLKATENVFNITTQKTQKKDKVILYWNDYFEAKDWGRGFGQKPFRGCEVKNCIVTNNHQLYKDSDAMLCHMRSPGCDANQLPTYRNSKQYWIYFLMESVVNSVSGRRLIPYNGKFNLTVTYKQNSNITHSYEEGAKLRRLITDKSFHFVKGKDTSVAWIVSNCVTSGSVQGRLAYVNELSKHINVKRYGGCRHHTQCGKTCYHDAAKLHKFYFAAENSICKDYVTEKPWWALEVGMIPIVYGYANYSEVLPHNSYIDVRDFKSPEELAKHLKEVGQNEELYNTYFKWRETYAQSKPLSDFMCRLCAYLNQENPPKGILYNLNTFWSESNDCVSPQTFHQAVMQGS